MGTFTSTFGFIKVDPVLDSVGMLVWFSSSSLARKLEISASSAENTCLVVGSHLEN
jgi:hypothetical protein